MSMNQKHGALTEPIAETIRALAVNAPNWRVFHDHAGPGRQRIWAHLDKKPQRERILSGVDILLADTETRGALLILEVEETACPPKTLLGNILAVALSDSVSVQGGSDSYAIEPETELWVCYVAGSQGQQRRRNERLLAKLKIVCREAATLPPIRLIAADSRDDLVNAVHMQLTLWFAGREGPAH